MRPHLIRMVDPKTRLPRPDPRPWIVECGRCGRLNQRGLTWVAANTRADAHKCPHE